MENDEGKFFILLEINFLREENYIGVIPRPLWVQKCTWFFQGIKTAPEIDVIVDHIELF